VNQATATLAAAGGPRAACAARDRPGLTEPVAGSHGGPGLGPSESDLSVRLARTDPGPLSQACLQRSGLRLRVSAGGLSRRRRLRS
jgi:hypothetical protein